jgi:hypothetical protein
MRGTSALHHLTRVLRTQVKLFEPYTLEKGAKPPPMKTGEAKKNIEGKWLYITVDDFIPCLKYVR